MRPFISLSTRHEFIVMHEASEKQGCSRQRRLRRLPRPRLRARSAAVSSEATVLHESVQTRVDPSVQSPEWVCRSHALWDGWSFSDATASTFAHGPEKNRTKDPYTAMFVTMVEQCPVPSVSRRIGNKSADPHLEEHRARFICIMMILCVRSRCLITFFQTQWASENSWLFALRDSFPGWVVERMMTRSKLMNIIIAPQTTPHTACAWIPRQREPGGSDADGLPSGNRKRMLDGVSRGPSSNLPCGRACIAAVRGVRACD